MKTISIILAAGVVGVLGLAGVGLKSGPSAKAPRQKEPRSAEVPTAFEGEKTTWHEGSPATTS